MPNETPIYDQMVRERNQTITGPKGDPGAPDPDRDPEGLALVKQIQDRHAARCATHPHHLATLPVVPVRATLAVWFGWIR